MITPLKDNEKIFSLLKEYQIYTDNCKIYMDRYSVIEGIEYYDMENNLKTDGTIVVLDALADNVVKICDFHTKCVNMYNKSLVELADEKDFNLLKSIKKIHPHSSAMLAFGVCIKGIKWCGGLENRATRATAAIFAAISSIGAF